MHTLLGRCVTNSDIDKKKKKNKPFTVFNPLKKLSWMFDKFSGLEDLIKNFLRRNTSKLIESHPQTHDRDFILKYFHF